MRVYIFGRKYISEIPPHHLDLVFPSNNNTTCVLKYARSLTQFKNHFYVLFYPITMRHLKLSHMLPSSLSTPNAPQAPAIDQLSRFRRDHFYLFLPLNPNQHRPLSHSHLPLFLLSLTLIALPCYSAARPYLQFLNLTGIFLGLACSFLCFSPNMQFVFVYLLKFGYD